MAPVQHARQLQYACIAECSPQGHGIYYGEDGIVYEGDWVNGLRHGKGRAIYGGRPSDGFGGDVYEGNWENDVRCGMQAAREAAVCLTLAMHGSALR